MLILLQSEPKLDQNFGFINIATMTPPSIVLAVFFKNSVILIPPFQAVDPVEGLLTFKRLTIFNICIVINMSW